MSAADNRTSLRRQRIQLLVIMGLFLLPVLAAWLWNANLDHWRPTATMNHGELIVPVRPLQPFTLHALAGEPVTLDTLHGKWTLVYIGSSQCAPACRNNLYKMRQVRLALNEKMERVQRLWILTDAPNDSLRGLLSEHEGLKVAAEQGAALDRFIAQFHSAVGGEERIYIIDPLGNLMMSYPADAEPKGMLKDLERLLTTSWVG